jgi:integrase
MLSRSPSLHQQWIKSIPLAVESARLLIRDVSQVYNAAVEDSRITKNPLSAKSVQRPAAVEKRAVAWTGDQILAITDELPAHLKAMAPLGASCGHRQGELFAIGDTDLDFLRKMCHIEWQVKYIGGKQYFAALKNKNIRDVPVADTALFAVARHMKQFPPVEVTLPLLRPDGTVGPPVTRRLIFTRPDGRWSSDARRAHTPASINAHWHHARERAGIPGLKFATGQHVLRHTAATTWLSNGLSLAKVAVYLGDTQEVVLSTYSHALPDDDDRAREIMNSFFVPSRSESAQNVPSAAAGEP